MVRNTTTVNNQSVSDTPHAMKRLNKQLILQAMRTEEHISRASIAGETAISPRLRAARGGMSHVIMVTVGTGIGCGLLLEGKPYRGARWAPGEIGYLLTDAGEIGHWDDPVYKGFGFRESKAGHPAIVRQYIRKVKSAGRSVLTASIFQGVLHHTDEEVVACVSKPAEKFC